MRVLILSDGAPGHVRQSEGVAAALARLGEVAIQRIPLVLRAGVSRGIARRLAPLALCDAGARIAYRDFPSPSRPPDLIVSAGGPTLAANLAIARRTGAPNVFCGTVPPRCRDGLALILTVHPSRAADPRHVLSLKPAAVDPGALPAARAWTGAANGHARRFALLVGGPSAEARLGPDDWTAAFGLVAATIHAWRARWLVVTSRRTPPEAYAALARLSAAHPAAVEVIDARSAGVGSIAPAFSADVVVVTRDSMSMISEAVAAQRRVVVLDPLNPSSGRDEEALDWLGSRRHLARLSLRDATPDALDAALTVVTPPDWNHLDVLAEILQTRLFPPQTGRRDRTASA